MMLTSFGKTHPELLQLCCAFILVGTFLGTHHHVFKANLQVQNDGRAEQMHRLMLTGCDGCVMLTTTMVTPGCNGQLGVQGTSFKQGFLCVTRSNFHGKGEMLPLL